MVQVTIYKNNGNTRFKIKAGKVSITPIQWITRIKLYNASICKELPKWIGCVSESDNILELSLLNNKFTITQIDK